MQAMFAAEFQLPEALSREYLVHHRVCPTGLTESGRVLVAVAEDAPPEALDDIAVAYGALVEPETASGDEVDVLIERLTARQAQAIELSRPDEAADELAADVRDLANQPPVVRYVNLLVRDAYEVGASDIHLEATRERLAVRFRLDGVLAPALEPPAELRHAVVSRIKLLAELDIAERRRPQDGRVRVRLERRELDLRVSTVPTMFGESVVLRLLDAGGGPVELGELGMPAGVRSEVERIARKPHGLFLVTGPTGSGKTTTLYATLGLRDAAAEKIITVEDPVEYQLPGITQVPVRAGAGVAFASALRSMLRQDPDVIMVGEMRDAETAEIAIQAAMTGHLVFSTLHTNDATGAVPRLLDLGIPRYLVAATLEAVLAQRLVRRVCEGCRERYRPDAASLARIESELGSDVEAAEQTFARGRGCETCRGTGYRGRTGLFELLVASDPVREAIANGASRSELRTLALEGGTRPLRTEGWRKAADGITTAEEVLRVLQQ